MSADPLPNDATQLTGFLYNGFHIVQVTYQDKKGSKRDRRFKLMRENEAPDPCQTILSIETEGLKINEQGECLPALCCFKFQTADERFLWLFYDQGNAKMDNLMQEFIDNNRGVDKDLPQTLCMRLLPA